MALCRLDRLVSHALEECDGFLPRNALGKGRHTSRHIEAGVRGRQQKGFGFFATVTGVFGYGAMLEGFFATGNARGFIATVQKVFLRRLGRFLATVNE